MKNAIKTIEILERERESSNLKNKKGITLIALVVTIIVLLILAGVTIATLAGENGLFSKALLAKKTMDEKTREEKEILNNIENEMSNYNSTKQRADINYSDKKDLWTNWLTEAEIDVNNYDSTQILNNESLMQTLMNNKNAIDYMKDSTEFIMPSVANSEVAMTKLANSIYLKDIIKNSSVTGILHNSGYVNKIDSKMIKNYTMSSSENENAKVIESSYSEESNKGWKAFDGTATWRNSWISGSGEAINETVHPTLIYQYKKESIVPYKFSIVGNTDGGLTGTAYIEASKDGNEYKKITDSFDIPADTTTNVYPNQNIDDYSYFKIVMTKETSNSGYNKAVFSEWEIYGIKEKDL